MGQISLTIPTAGSTDFAVAAVNVDSDLQTIETWANGNVDGSNVVASVTGRRLIASASAFVPGGQGVGNYFVAADGTLVPSGTGSTKALMWWDLDPANFTVVGKTNTLLIVRMSLATNAVAPGMDFQGKLSAVTFSSGTAGTIAPTIGSQISAAQITTPGASAAAVAESGGGAVAFPSAGAYAPAINLDGTTAANSATSILWQLFVLNT